MPAVLTLDLKARRPHGRGSRSKIGWSIDDEVAGGSGLMHAAERPRSGERDHARGKAGSRLSTPRLPGCADPLVLRTYRRNSRNVSRGSGIPTSGSSASRTSARPLATLGPRATFPAASAPAPCSCRTDTSARSNFSVRDGTRLPRHRLGNRSVRRRPRSQVRLRAAVQAGGSLNLSAWFAAAGLSALSESFPPSAQQMRDARGAPRDSSTSMSSPCPGRPVSARSARQPEPTAMR